VTIHVKKLLLLFIVSVLVSVLGQAQKVQYSPIERSVVETRLEAVQRKNEDRQRTLQELFQAAGCSDVRLQQLKRSKVPNVICVLPGQDERTVIVGAHFDHVADGMGAVDNWAGASLLPSLYQALAGEKRCHTFVFIGFTDEEKGMVGSRAYLDSLTPEEFEKPLAMINLDTLGLNHTEVWVETADKTLSTWAAAVAKVKQLPLSGVNVGRVGDTDSTSFSNRSIPAITFHSLTQETLPILHSSRDVLAAVKRDDLYTSYQFLAAYLAFVDARIDAALREAMKEKRPVFQKNTN
jgi:hypothetical protein